MGRWEPGASNRLHEAAVELYLERGFEQTMVVDIAARAGVTARTFFRHYADKREVFFAGSAEIQDKAVAALEAAPDSAPALDAVSAALEAAAETVGSDRDLVRKRRIVIQATPELQERDLIKLASMSGALAGGLRRRGVDGEDARLAAEVGLAVYRVAFDRWLNATEDDDLGEAIRESLGRLRTLALSA
jgi:AcrR family transcriptional regulator